MDSGRRDDERDQDSGRDVAQDGGLVGVLSSYVFPKVVRERYAAKFILSLLLVVLIIAGLGVMSFVQIEQIIENDAEDTLRSTATLQADSISEWLGGMRVRTRAVASSYVYGGGQHTRIRAYLQESRDVSGDDVVGIHYVDPDTDQVVASTNRKFEGEPATVISPAVSVPIEKVVNGTATVAMTQSAYTRSGDIRMAFASEVRGGSGVVILVGDVTGDFEQIQEDRSVAVTRVVDAEGNGVLTPQRNYASDLVETAEFQRTVAGATTIVERDNSVVGLAPVPETDWIVTTSAPKSELYRASHTVGRNVAISVSVSLVALAVVGLIVGRQTVLPLIRLRRRAEEMEAGNLDVDLSTRREDEIGQLFVSFGNMRDALREQIREAESAQMDAEQSRRELERQNERLDHFASTVSHDLRNPLTVARGNLELLRGQVDTGVDGEEDSDDAGSPGQLFERIERAHERIETIIGDVLALARGGEQIEETAPIDLQAVARDAWTTVDTQDATLTVTESRVVEADRDRLQRALENLFRNAIDHVGPAVSIEVGLTDTGFYVVDDGPGIPASDAEAVFEYGHTTNDGGTGLGLSIIRTIAEAHGWEVAVDTEYDAGARLVFSGVFETASTAAQ